METRGEGGGGVFMETTNIMETHWADQGQARKVCSLTTAGLQDAKFLRRTPRILLAFFLDRLRGLVM